MTDLLVFLRARLDDDERIALAAPRYNWTIYLAGDPETGEYTEQRVLDHVIRYDPARVLREVEAKRRILDLHSVDHECSTIRRGIDCVGEPYEEINNCTWVVDEDCSTVRLLALPYADHPEFRPEWRP